MTRRRAVSEVVAATILLAVIAASSFLALNNASKRIIENQNSIHDALELKGGQIQEAISIISKKSDGDTITVELLNYGLKDIVITEILVDGTSSPYTLVDSSGTSQDSKMIRNRILSLLIPKSGQTVQIITNTKNMLKITI
ncbi:MAG: hypothetical protein EPO63_08845 [Candidatus Nitrosotenuis sp.]|nr:MAG: hypothetical protein EPO63_08845 [Candidatus Nitrosotenuis sp.]